MFNLSGTSVAERRITLIKDVDPMIINMAIRGRCISIWRPHKANEPHDPYSLECVLQDEEVLSVWFKKILFIHCL